MEVQISQGERWGLFCQLGPFALSQDEADPPLPPAGSPCNWCYVESWLTAFPPFMVGVPELFLERCLSSISCSDGSRYIQTVAEMQTKGRKEEDKDRRWSKGDGGEQMEKMGVQTWTRSGVRMGQLYQAEREKTREWGHTVSTLFYHTAWQVLLIRLISWETHAADTT